MTTSELITPQHLTRKAIIYIRQSSPHQVLTNRESLRLQYALRERAMELGWRPEEIEIIDGDLGLSGTATHYREGFKELLPRVTLGEVGIILSVEVQRLSRNCSDWYPLLDLCGYKHCLIADRDGVYEPGTPNGRMLLAFACSLLRYPPDYRQLLRAAFPTGIRRAYRVLLVCPSGVGSPCSPAAFWSRRE
jgi:DNA invertase Pin-like site-specific DNA recombinase